MGRQEARQQMVVGVADRLLGETAWHKAGFDSATQQSGEFEGPDVLMTDRSISRKMQMRQRADVVERWFPDTVVSQLARLSCEIKEEED